MNKKRLLNVVLGLAGAGMILAGSVGIALAQGTTPPEPGQQLVQSQDGDWAVTEQGGLGTGRKGQGRVVDGQAKVGGNGSVSGYGGGNGLGSGVGNGSGSGNVRSAGSESLGGNGAGQGGTGAAAQNTGIAEAVEWELLSGEVVAVGNELTVRAADGDVIVGLGQEQYRQDAGFVVALGDTVSVQGYAEDGEFKAGSIENMTTGQSLVLRTETGRPLWAGNGQRVNQRQDI